MLQALSEYLIGPICDKKRATFGVEESQGASVTLKIPRVSPQEQMEAMRNSPVPIRKKDWYKMHEIIEPTQEEISRGETFIPNQVAQGNPNLGIPAGFF